MLVKNFFNHLHTVLHHKRLVFYNCRHCGILWQGLTHDLSKFSPSEFIPSVKYYQGDKSPNTKEREIFGYSACWLHHKGRNKHHFEYWTDYNSETHTVSPVKMPDKYVVEMFCDRIAASKTYLKDKYTPDMPYNYYMKSTAKRKNLMHPDTADKLYKLLVILKDDGEKVAFQCAKNLVKYGKFEMPPKIMIKDNLKKEKYI